MMYFCMSCNYDGIFEIIPFPVTVTTRMTQEVSEGGQANIYLRKTTIHPKNGGFQ